MKLPSLSVATRLNLMCIMICMSGILGVVGAMEITKGAEMHKLNFLHVKYNHQFNDKVTKFRDGLSNDTSAMKRAVSNIKQQPIDCLGIIGIVENLVMTAIGTDEAIRLCEVDLALANQLLNEFSRYEQAKIEKEEFTTILSDAVAGFTRNSEEFEPLVETTVNTVSIIVIASVILKAIFVAIFGYFMSRGIERDYRRLQLAESTLEADFKKRIDAENELEKLNLKLQDAAREAGKSEVATGVLHNVGNVLNSVNVSASLLREGLNHSSVDTLEKASQVISEHRGDLEDFLTNDMQGIHFPSLLEQLVSRLQQEKAAQREEIDSISRNIDHIKEIVAMQQSMAKQSGMTDLIDAVEIFNDAVKINDLNSKRSGIRIIKDFAGVKKFQGRRHEILQILINLIKNAIQAVEQNPQGGDSVWISIHQQDEFVFFKVKDSGVGIAGDNQGKIFQHGFTTKQSGHGFGLHSCANFAQEMGGNLTFESRGLGQGATFTLSVPIEPAAPINTTIQNQQSIVKETKSNREILILQ